MNHTQFLIFEICRECNLGAAHSKCPNLHPDRCLHCDTTAPLTDAQIIDAIADAHALGFRGMIGFHYYNEPLIARDRMLGIIDAAKARVPTSRFVLWTNGHMIPTDEPGLQALRVFDAAWVTQYDTRDYSRIKRAISKTTFLRWQLDGRADTPKKQDDRAPCGRMFSEMIFDYFGNVHACCLDWRGESRLGNLRVESFATLASRFVSMRDRVSGKQMADDAPSVCLRCVGRHAHVADLVHDIARTARAHMARLAAESKPDPKPRQAVRIDTARRTDAVIAVAYRIPAERVRAHFEWNDSLYRAHGIAVVLTVEQPYDGLPEYVRQLPYPEPMQRFSLTRTKNFAIRAAVESGHRVVISSDIDIHWTAASLRWCSASDEHEAVVPMYRMARTLKDRTTDFVFAPNATGTVAMLADNWRAVHYADALDGYGCDDSALLDACKKAGISICRADGAELWHIAHQEGTPQREFDKTAPRVDHWGRANGFNPESFAKNRQLTAKPVDASALWGLPRLADLAFVVTHYKMPSKRLADFIDWNCDAFERHGARLVVVSDRSRYDIALPSWVRVAQFPRSLEIFNLAATSNFGIRLVGQGIICKTDPDCFFPFDLVQEIARLAPGSGLCPRYRMADDASEQARDRATIWEASKGTVALHWNHWAAICGYDERQQGYGIEDGDAYHRAGHAVGFTCARGDLSLWHVAHTDAKQTIGNTRSDLWGRGDGFNPANHRANQVVRRDAWHTLDWGRAAEFAG